MDGDFDDVIDAFLTDRRGREKRMQITRREIVDFLLLKGIESATPSELLAEIARYLKRARDRGFLMRVAVGRYVVGDFSGFSEYELEERSALAPDDQRAEILELRRAIDAMNREIESFANDFQSVGALARSSRFFVSNISRIELSNLHGLSF